MIPPHGRAEIEAMFGSPALPDGTLDPSWERKSLVVVEPPHGWRLRYQSEKGPVPSRGIRMHRLVEQAFLSAMSDVWKVAVERWPSDPLAWLREKRLDLHGGGFNFRAVRGSKKLSLHAYGIAIDWDPLHNARGSKPETWTLPEWWYEVWSAHGWIDGRHFSPSDAMHVQWATGA